MRNIYASFFAGALTVLASLQSAQAAPGVAVNSPSASAGNSADILVALSNNGTTLASLQFELLFDPARGTPQIAQASTNAAVNPNCSISTNRLICFFTLFGPPLPNDFTTRIPFSVSAGASGSFPLTFDFVEFGDTAGKPVVGTTTNGTFTILATPAAVFGAIPAPAQIDMGLLTPMQSVSRQILLQNIALSGASNLTVSGCTVTGSGFALDNPPSFPLQIVPGNSSPISVRATAGTTLEVLTGSLRCNHSGAGSPAIWPLRAEVVGQLLFFDGFE